MVYDNYDVFEQFDEHFQRLTRVVDYSYMMQQSDRRLHQEITRHIKPQFYPTDDGSAVMATSMPLLSLAARGMIRMTMSKSPRVLAHTTKPENKSWVEDAEISANQRIVESNLDETLAEVSRCSMTSFGIFYLGADYVGNRDGMKLELVHKAIDRSDFVFDHESSTLEDADYQGHKFRMRVIDIKEHPLFGPGKFSVSASHGQKDDSSRTNERGGLNADRADLYDYAEVWCIYDRPRGKIFYYPVEQPTIKLAELEWNGPNHGPYRYLYYEKVPQHAVPIAPLTHLLKKHLSYNVLDGKSIDQQQVSKWLLFYSNASKEEAKRIVDSYDNQSVLQENGAVRGMHIGGTSPDTVSMTEKQRSDFSYAAGGLDTWAGLSGVNAETATESRLLQGAASGFIEDMQGAAEKFVKGVAEDIFWFDLRDPDPQPREVPKTEPITGETYGVPWTREKRLMIAEMKFDVDIEPYSYRLRGPEGRLADFLGALQIVQGLGDQLMMQGITLDANAIVDLLAKYKNIPELNDALVRNQNPEELAALMRQGGGRPSPQDMGQPRRYERVSKSDGAGKDQAMMQMLGRSMGQSQEVVAA